MHDHDHDHHHHHDHYDHHDHHGHHNEGTHPSPHVLPLPTNCLHMCYAHPWHPVLSESRNHVLPHKITVTASKPYSRCNKPSSFLYLGIRPHIHPHLGVRMIVIIITIFVAWRWSSSYSSSSRREDGRHHISQCDQQALYRISCDYQIGHLPTSTMTKIIGLIPILPRLCDVGMKMKWI